MTESRPVFLARRPAWRWLICGLLGFAGLAAIMAVFLLSPNAQDIRPVLVVAFCAFYLATLVAPFGRRGVEPAGLTVLLVVGVGLALAMSAAKMALTDPLFRELVLSLAVAGAAFAAISRWLGRVTRSAAFVGVAGVIASVVFALQGAPLVLDQAAFSDRTQAVSPFVFHGLDGAEMRSTDFKGKVLVVSYWATWCPPCQAEMPEIAALQRRYRDDARVKIIPIDAGYGGDDAVRARAYLQRRNLGLESAIDDVPAPGHKQNQAGISLGLKVVPTLYILDTAGQVRATHVGYDASERLQRTLTERIDKLLAAPRS